jgi:hypothetical protein
LRIDGDSNPAAKVVGIAVILVGLDVHGNLPNPLSNRHLFSRRAFRFLFPSPSSCRLVPASG